MYSLNSSVQLSLVKDSDNVGFFIDASVLSTGIALVKVNDDLSTDPIIMESRIYNASFTVSTLCRANKKLT